MMTRTLLILTVAFAATADDRVARGKYLVEGAGACAYCHTPKLDNGELDKAKWMKGATLDYGPLTTIPNWHKTSPDLTPTGPMLKKWGVPALIHFLETGKTPKDAFAGPPMPPYRFTHEDADAVVEYLKTLP